MTPSGRVIHGPFIVRWRLVAFTVGVGFLGALMLFFALRHQHIRCDAAASARCMIDDAPAFTRRSIASVNYVVQHSRGVSNGIVTFALTDGTSVPMMNDVDVAQASQAAERIQDSLATNAPIDVELHGPRIWGLFSILPLAGFVAWMWTTLALMGRYDLVVSPDAQRLVVRWRLAGVPIRTHNVSLARATRVSVERKMVAGPAGLAEGEVPIPGGRLVLHYRDDTYAPLTRVHLPGLAAHLRAARALRTALKLDADEHDDRELASIPVRVVAMNERVMVALTGAIFGFAFAMIFVGIAHTTQPARLVVQIGCTSALAALAFRLSRAQS